MPSRPALAGLAGVCLVLVSGCVFLLASDGWPEWRLTDVLGLVTLACALPFAVAFVAVRWRDAPREATSDPPLDALPSSPETSAPGGFERGLARVALENQRLATELSSTLVELRASRRRILSAADNERRRIERDLHDGAQQRLVALGIRLELAADLVETDPARAAGRLRELARDVDEAVDEVRDLARGLVPPTLVERGLVEALREVATSSPLIARVQAADVGRYTREIESAVYFCCREALQNAAKHAAGARFVTVRLWEDDELRFEVRDDGAGLPHGPRQHGAGLTNMRDRIGAVGGSLGIASPPGEGTRVAGSAPLRPLELRHEDEELLHRAAAALEGNPALRESAGARRLRKVMFRSRP